MSVSSSSSAIVRPSIRKYGGVLTVPTELPCPLDVQITDMKLMDPYQIIECGSEYEKMARTDNFYAQALEDDDPSLRSESAQIVLIGRTEEGYSVCTRVPFNPYLFLFAQGMEWTQSEQDALGAFIEKVTGLFRDDFKIQRQMTKRLYEWIPDPNDPTKTEEIPVLKITLPNKKMFDKVVENMDPTKSFEKILRDLKRVKEEIAAMEKYKYIKKSLADKLNANFPRLKKKMDMIKSNYNRLNRDAENGYSYKSTVVPPTDVPAVTDINFKCKELNMIQGQWNTYYKLTYIAIDAWKKVGFHIRDIRKPVHIQLWETTVDCVHKFCDQTRIIPSGWYRLDKYSRPEGCISHAQIECTTGIDHIKPLDKPSIAPLLIASVDFEMYSDKPWRFPNALCKSNAIITMGCVLTRSNSTLLEKFAFCLKDADPVPDAVVEWFDNEVELLKRWRDFITVEADPDFITGYNILGFDWKYAAERAAEKWKEIEKKKKEKQVSEDEEEDDDNQGEGNDETAKKSIINDDDEIEVQAEYTPFQKVGDKKEDMNNRFFRLSRIWAEITPLRTQVFKSSAYGERRSYHFDMSGRAVQDLLIYVRREHKLESYKLNFVSEHFLKDNKIDLDHKVLFKHFETGAKERGLIAEYCIKDCVLPIQLLKHAKLMVVQNLVEMSRVTYTPLPQIINRGQQIKVFNQLVWYAHLNGFVMNDQPHRFVDEYEGATVLDPKPGWYDMPVVVLDFASLYPSVIRDRNLCWSTYVVQEKYKNLPGVSYNRIPVGDKVHTFVGDNILKGVLPTLEENLLGARKDVKKLMKTEKDPDAYAMKDAKQLAIKVSCNSAYGFTGAANGMYPEPSIAESITATGRKMIEITKDTILKRYAGSDVLYGDTDSVMINFNLSSDKEGIKKGFELGKEVAGIVSRMFSEAVSLEMEKVYFPWLLFGKKRYVGLKYEDAEKEPKLDPKGIETVRRDWSALVREIYKKCLNKVFYDRDIEGAKKMVREYCQDMIDDKLNFKWFVMSKELKSKYANPDSQVHVNVVKKIAKRTPGSEPQVGDRVPYVMIRTAKKTKKMSDKSEDPAYVQQNKVPVDYEYYIDKQLEGPLTKFFEPFMNNPKELFKESKRLLHNQYGGFGRGGLMSYFKKDEEMNNPDDDGGGEELLESLSKRQKIADCDLPTIVSVVPATITAPTFTPVTLTSAPTLSPVKKRKNTTDDNFDMNDDLNRKKFKPPTETQSSEQSALIFDDFDDIEQVCSRKPTKLVPDNDKKRKTVTPPKTSIKTQPTSNKRQKLNPRQTKTVGTLLDFFNRQ